jgi:hypothetical protein
MTQQCTYQVHRGHTRAEHFGCDRGVPARKTAIGGSVTVWSHLRNTANVLIWDIAKKLWGNYE